MIVTCNVSGTKANSTHFTVITQGGWLPKSLAALSAATALTLRSRFTSRSWGFCLFRLCCGSDAGVHTPVHTCTLGPFSTRFQQEPACCWMSQTHLGTVCLCLGVPRPSHEENSQGLLWSLSFSVPSKSLLNLGSVTSHTPTWPIQPHKHQAGLTETDITSVNLKKQNTQHTHKQKTKQNSEKVPPRAL